MDAGTFSEADSCQCRQLDRMRVCEEDQNTLSEDCHVVDSERQYLKAG